MASSERKMAGTGTLPGGMRLLGFGHRGLASGRTPSMRHSPELGHNGRRLATLAIRIGEAEAATAAGIAGGRS
jgi:hypothetical protein